VKAFALALLFVLLCPLTALADTSKVAPVDEYFGRLKLSVLGIGNVISDMKSRVEADPSKAPSVFGRLADAEDALHEWEQKYPHDTWIPRTLYALVVVYSEAKDDRAPQLMQRVERWLADDYPTSDYTAKCIALLASQQAQATTAAAPSSP
jgi:hypothetical protein